MASASDIVVQAAMDGNLGLLKMMASDVNLREAKDEKGRNALYLAAEKGHLEVCTFLVEESGFDVDSVCVEGRRPVHGAAAGGSESVLSYLLDHGGDPVMPDYKGSTPLHDAADGGHCETVRLLLSKGIDVDANISLGKSPLHSIKRTPLHLAACKGKDEVLKILLDHGADPNKVVRQVFTPLLVACLLGSLKCMKLLVEAGADVNFRSSRGPILREAVNYGLTDSVKFLLDAGADPNIPDKDGRILILWAAVLGKREMVELLFPRTKPIQYLPDWSIDGIIRSMKLICFQAGLSQGTLLEKELLAYPQSRGKEALVREPDDIELEGDIELEEYVQGSCKGSFAKILRLFCGIDVVGSKTKGSKILCQAYRYVIDMFKDNKSWGGAFTPRNLRVTRTGRFRINLAPLLPATLESLWADLMGLKNSMSAYFVLNKKTSVYVGHLFNLCEKLNNGSARNMDKPDSLNRYLVFIYNHPCFGFSIERSDLIKGFGMTLKYSSTTDITAIEECLSTTLDPTDEDNNDWREKVKNVPILKDVFWASLNEDNISKTRFDENPKDNLLFCRHSLEHGAERTLIKTGEKRYQMLCPMCKQDIKSKYQQNQVASAASARWSRGKRITKSTQTIQTQTQPLPCPGELDLLVADVFDKFIADSILEILLEPKLDRNPFIQARWKAFARSISPELNSEELNNDDEEKDEGAAENAGLGRARGGEGLKAGSSTEGFGTPLGTGQGNPPIKFGSFE